MTRYTDLIIPLDEDLMTSYLQSIYWSWRDCLTVLQVEGNLRKRDAVCFDTCEVVIRTWLWLPAVV